MSLHFISLFPWELLSIESRHRISFTFNNRAAISSYFHNQLFCCFLDKWINRWIHNMSESREKCPSKLPSDFTVMLVVWDKQPKSQIHIVYNDIKQNKALNCHICGTLLDKRFKWVILSFTQIIIHNLTSNNYSLTLISISTREETERKLLLQLRLKTQLKVLLEVKQSSYQGRKDGLSIEADERRCSWSFVFLLLLTFPQLRESMLHKPVVVLHQVSSAYDS